MLGAIVLAVLAAVLMAMARAAVERAHAQRAADELALASALRQGSTATVHVRGPSFRQALPAVAGGAVVVTPQATAVAAAGAPPAGDVPAWVPGSYRDAIRAAAAAEGLAPALLAAQIARESGFDQHAVSAAGAVGIAQFLPGTWAGTWNPWRTASPLDPLPAIRAEAHYLSRLVALFGGDVPRALAAYNAGVSRARGSPATWPAETRAYVPAVLALAQGGALAPEPHPTAHLVG
jgi:soluble lytic murein transglycosylase-like protein